MLHILLLNKFNSQGLSLGGCFFQIVECLVVCFLSFRSPSSLALSRRELHFHFLVCSTLHLKYVLRDPARLQFELAHQARHIRLLDRDRLLFVVLLLLTLLLLLLLSRFLLQLQVHFPLFLILGALIHIVVQTYFLLALALRELDLKVHIVVEVVFVLVSDVLRRHLLLEIRDDLS